MAVVPESPRPRVPSRAIAAVVLAAAAVALSGAVQQRPDVLLITLDTTRADRMGFLGSARGLTPALDAFARGATVFTRAYAQAPVTTVSHATILTGTYPPVHGVDELGAPLGASLPYLPEILRQAGYRTGAFVGSLVLDPKNGTAPGFERGFDRYDAGFRLRRPGEDRYQTVERRGDEVVSRALAWRAASRDAPSFLWVHLFEPHDPYDPPADLRARFAKAPYDGEIAAVDRLAGRLIAAAGAETVIVVAADHGEALGDHGETTHGVFLYEATLHVPLVVSFPDRAGSGVRVTARVRLADVAPTILDAVGIAVPAGMQGESLRGLAGARGAGRTGGAGTANDADRPAYSETAYPRQAFGWSPLASWRADRFLLVKAPRRELYDLVADPAALHDLASSRGRVADGMEAELAAFLRSGGSGRSGAPDRSGRVDPAVAERLAALGYVSGSGSAPMSGVDPKDRIAIANTLHEAIVAVEDAAFARAIPLLERVTASEPQVPIAQLNLGIAYARQKQFARAVPSLARAIALQPDDLRGRYELGSALYESGDAKGAAVQFAAVAAKMPQWADARYSLGSVYARIDRVDDAVAELRAAIALEPRHFRANLLLGRILTLRGDKASALPYLQTAVSVDPTSAEAKQFLADALKR